MGVIYSTDDAGIALKAGFVAKCADLGIDVVSVVAVPTGLIWTAEAGMIAAIDVGNTLSRIFKRNNVHTYYLAVPNLEDAYVTLAAINRSGISGPGYHILVPPHLVGAQPTAATADLFALLHGAIGVIHHVNPRSASADVLWEAWPKNVENWTALLDTTPLLLERRSIPQPSLTRRRISWFSYFVWDATVFAAKAIATSYNECSRDDTNSLDIACVLPRLRATQINGITGTVRLDAVGDRYGTYNVINILNDHQRSRVGAIEVLTASSTADIDIPSIVWSDGVSGLISAPQHGQQPLPPTSAPVANNMPVALPTESVDATASIIISVLVGVLAVVTITIVGHRTHARRRKLRPADFRKVGALFLGKIVTIVNERSLSAPLPLIAHIWPTPPSY
jgi:hypothetical protein